MTQLELKRPLVAFDLETTGLDVKTCRIIQIAMVKYHPDREAERYATLVNPRTPIPAEVVQLTGISNEAVKSKPYLEEVADKVVEFIKDADLCGYNAAQFDVPVLRNELRRVGKRWPRLPDRKTIDPYLIWRKQEPRTLAHAITYYIGTDMTGAHDAVSDVEATLQILEAQVERYAVPRTVPELAQHTLFPHLDSGRKFKQVGEEVVLDFGKHRGMTLKNVPRSYIDWMLSEMDDEVKSILREHLGNKEEGVLI